MTAAFVLGFIAGLAAAALAMWLAAKEIEGEREMSNAPRYRLVGYDIGTAPDENGGWVHWTDHEAEIAKLTADLAESRAYPLTQFFAGKMSKKPERIWSRPDYNECWHKRLEEEDVEYVRADLYAAQAEEIARLTAERDAALAGAVKSRSTFPILNGNGARIDLQLVIDHGGRAKDNHGQTVNRLAERGGLSWCELYAVLHNKRWEKIDTNEAMIACRALEARYLAAIQPDPDARQADLAKAWTMATAAMAERAKSELSAAWAADLIVQWAQSLTPPADLAAKIGGE